MKVSEMIKNLEAFMGTYGDAECYYAVDDEGNDYHPVYYTPSHYYINKYGEVFAGVDIEGEDPEDVAELREICIVN